MKARWVPQWRGRVKSRGAVPGGLPLFRRGGQLALAVVLIGFLTPLPLHSQPIDAARLWGLLQSASADRSLIGPGLTEVRQMRTVATGAEAEPLLDAYEGAFLAMSATTTVWPPSKLSRALDGLSLLDQAVAAAPTDPTVRFLRLIICHHVPSLFRRGDSARRDADALAGILLRPSVTTDSGREQEMAKFLLSTEYLADSVQTAIRGRFPRT